MSGLTSELNLITPDGEDDTADYLDLSLEANLLTIDGLFNAGTGHAHNGAHQGSLLGPNAFADNSIPGSKLVDGSVTAVKLAPGIIGPEALFAGTSVNAVDNYTVVSPVMFVFCSREGGLTVTLPIVSTNRPITVVGVVGQVTLAAVSGGIVGGSVNLGTGAIMNGICSQGDSLTYKSDGTNWRVV